MHPSFGNIWEQIVLTNLKVLFPKATFFFYRTSAGAELDIVMDNQGEVYGFECKATSTPMISKGNYLAIEDIKPKNSFVVAPVNTRWRMNKSFEVISLSDLKYCTSEIN